MIKADSDSQQPTTSTPPTIQTPPSFPTYNPAQQNKSMMKNAPLPPINESTTNLDAKNKPTNIVSGGIVTPPMTPSPATKTTTPNSTATQPVMPAKPKFPDPTTKTYIKADGTKTDKSGSNNGTNNNNSNKKPKKKSNWKMAVGVIALLFVVLGTGTGFYLTQQSQDLRQQASDCIQQCPGTDGVLRSCTPAEADGTASESFCNSAFIGNIASCNDIDFCCNGANWTGDMTACATPENCSACSVTSGEEDTWVTWVDRDGGCDSDFDNERVETPNDSRCTQEESCSACSVEEGKEGTWVTWTDLDGGCDSDFDNERVETPNDSRCVEVDAVSCDSLTGTLTYGTVADTTTEMTYEVTSSGGDLIDIVQISIHGNFEGPGVTEGWVTLIREDNPTDNTLTSSTTYGEMIDLLVATGHDEQELIEKGIKYGVNVYGPEGRCKGDDTWSETGNSCTYNGTCDGTISIAASIEAVACNETCSTDEECQLTDNNYVCDTTTTNTCRLNSNLTSTTCQAADDDDGSSNDDYSTVGCNDICVTNSDCQDTDHICVTTADGSNRCRLTAYTSSESCVIESSGDTTTDTTTQPSLPAELPESGPEDWLNWLKAGLVTMGIGTALFLLL